MANLSQPTFHSINLINIEWISILDWLKQMIPAIVFSDEE